ncbi:MAG: four helix bundle protein [Proteobacteria bacterium]|nr:four helix bundle protein [Pseudomonadota bacterium]
MAGEKLGFAKNFEDLLVFKRAYKTSLEIHRTTLTFPAAEQRGLGEQMRRASKSICANLAEEFGKGSDSAEMRRFTRIGLGSSEEMRVWLRYCLDLRLINKTEWQMWRDEYHAISQMLQKLIGAIKAPAKK